jgi:hypothetical protein
VKRERWTESDIDNLPSEEPDVFERKSGRLLSDPGNFYRALAKALSAFANSGGGSLIIGVDDNGIPDGVERFKGDTPIRDWIEQKIPHLLEYPLSDFRVHTVEKSAKSRIPPDREVVVIDVGDSAAAPHQSSQDKIYYRRQGGRSEPARHFDLELLRQRLTNPILEFKLACIDLLAAVEHDNGLLICICLKFDIHNAGRVAAYEWNLSARKYNNSVVPEVRLSDYFFGSLPVAIAIEGGIPLNRTILPGCVFCEMQNVGVLLRPSARTADAVRVELEQMLCAAVFYYQLATETSPGQLTEVQLRPAIDLDSLTPEIHKKALAYFNI